MLLTTRGFNFSVAAMASPGVGDGVGAGVGDGVGAAVMFAGGSGYKMPHGMDVNERRSFWYKRTLEMLPTARGTSLKPWESLVG